MDFTIKSCCDCLHAGVEFVGGDMFQSVPSGDAVVLKVCYLVKDLYI